MNAEEFNISPEGLESLAGVDLIGRIIANPSSCGKSLNRLTASQALAWRVVDNDVPAQEAPKRRLLAVPQLTEATADASKNMLVARNANPG
jgi:hypothetical protein